MTSGGKMTEVSIDGPTVVMPTPGFSQPDLVGPAPVNYTMTELPPPYEPYQPSQTSVSNPAFIPDQPQPSHFPMSPDPVTIAPPERRTTHGDPECQMSGEGDELTKFTEKSIRLGFVRKVFGLLSIQLLVTVGVVCIFLYVKDVRRWVRNNDWFYWALSILVIILMLVIGCIDALRKQSPLNVCMLMFFTVAMSCLLGAFAGAFETDEILIAAGVVVVVVLTMTLLGLQTRFDFTPLVGVVAVIAMVMCSYALLCLFFRARYNSLFYACCGALIFSLYLLLDIHLLMGGKRGIAIDPEEYVCAALQIYCDIILIFMYILSIIGLSKR